MTNGDDRPDEGRSCQAEERSDSIADNSEITALTLLTALLTALVVFRQLVDENQRREAEASLLGEHAQAAERAARQAFHDPLTGLPNRRRLHELLQAEIAASRLTGRPVTLAFLDLNYGPRLASGSGAGCCPASHVTRDRPVTARRPSPGLTAQWHSPPR